MKKRCAGERASERINSTIGANGEGQSEGGGVRRGQLQGGRNRRGGGGVKLTSISSSASSCEMHLSTFFFELSCSSPAIRSSSRMKYAFWKLKMMSSSHTLP